MKVTPASRRQLRIVNAIFILLFLVSVTLLQWLSREYHFQFDWTQNSRHSLSEASIAAVTKLDKPITIIAYASKRVDRKTVINELFARYQRHNQSISLQFIDPDTNPEKIREMAVQVDGEVHIHYGDKSEVLTQLDEETVTNALTRLGHEKNSWLVFVSGHGERSPDRQANFDLSNWASHLRKRGFKTRSIQLSEIPQVPDNTAALVIAGPRTELLAGEIKAIEDYLQAGGNLLWLADPGPLFGLEKIAEKLGIEFQNGTIIDPNSQQVTGSANIIVIANYINHPIVKNFTKITLFPTVQGISVATPENWSSSVFIDSRDTSWLELGQLDQEVEFNKGVDISGPINIAVSLQRQHDNDHQQRIAVIGDGDFLSNTYLGNGGNLELGLSLANWISREDAYVNIPVRTAIDSSLNLTHPIQISIALVFLVLLPLSLTVTGVTIWARRRKR